MKYRLSVLAIFKNEAHALDEWIAHHLKHGVEHFYLANNRSKDDFRPILLKYADKVDCIDWLPIHQSNSYNAFLPKIKAETEWVAVIDLDEFLFSPQGRPIIDVLDEFKPPIAGVSVPWVKFGSNRQRHQPPSIVKGFTQRG